MFHLFLDIIEASDENATLLSIKYLLDTAVIYQEGSAISRRSFGILNYKIGKINGVTSKLISSLHQFKRKYQYHEM